MINQYPRHFPGLSLVAVLALLAEGPGLAGAAEPILTPDFRIHEPASPSTYQSSPVTASNGADFLAVWTESDVENRIMAARVRGSDGAVLDPEGILIATYESYQSAPSVASDGRGFLVVWEDLREATGSDIFAARITLVDSALPDIAIFCVVEIPGEQMSPAVASSGDGYLIAWEDFQVGASFNIFAARVGADGRALPAGGTMVQNGGFNKFRPVVASAGGHYLVAWEDFRNRSLDVYATRLRGSDASLMDPEAIPLSTADGDQTNLAIASNGEDYLVAWEDYRMRGASDIFAARIRGADAVLLDPIGITLTSAPSHQIFPTASSSGGDFLVAWEDYHSEGRGVTDIVGTRVSSLDGSHLESDYPLHAGAESQFLPFLSSIEGKYLLAYQDMGLSGESFRIRARFSQFDEDTDRDRVPNGRDNCRGAPNADQLDTDADGLGDVCDPDADGDTVADVSDNCLLSANAGQEDGDGDGLGDACDPFQSVVIDVEPWDPWNLVRTGCGSWVQVAVMGTARFDVLGVNPASVTFAGAYPYRIGRYIIYLVWDLDRDGNPDMLFFFPGETLNLGRADTRGELKGHLKDGTAIAGWDRITVLR